MSHFSDDIQNDDFSNASAEEWSKPTPPAERPAPKPEPTDRWGSPIPERAPSSEPSRWGSQPGQPAGGVPAAKKSGSKWWVIVIIVLAVLCLCACLAFFALPALGVVLFPIA